MKSKVVVFGPDNSGKSTLCESIKKDFGYEHLNPLGPAKIIKQLNYMVKNLKTPDLVVFDRFPVIEEFACGRVLRGSSNFDNCQDIANICLAAVDLFIFCNPPIENIVDWGEREQMNGIKENITELYCAYNRVFKYLGESGLNVIEYDWTRESEYDKIIKEIKE